MKTDLRKRVILVVLDGWGHREETKHNSIAQADTPIMDQLIRDNSYTLIEASGKAVGLPEGQMGNSEIGHMTLGSGRVIDTDYTRITKQARNHRLIEMPALRNCFDHVKKNQGIIHFMGLLGPGGVHAHDEHLMALVAEAKQYGVKNVAIHGFTDGRDTPPQSAINYVAELIDFLENEQYGFIASLSGRYYSMDRDNNWDRLQAFLDIAIENKTVLNTNHPVDTINESYRQGLYDEYIKPMALHRNAQVKSGDGIVIYNFRTDRVKMLATRLQSQIPQAVNLVTMTKINDELELPVIFPPNDLSGGLAEIIAKENLSQLHIAETEKFAHVTYYFNGGKHQPNLLEKQVLVDSRKDVATHDLAPEMKALEITNLATDAIDTQDYNFILINYANPDMVGHTANAKALKTAIETVDYQLGSLINAARKKHYQIIITADHGNAEIEYDEDNQTGHTAHTSNPVPFLIVDRQYQLRSDGSIADVAPTILNIMGLLPSKYMTGKSLIVD